MGAWIEIMIRIAPNLLKRVAPHVGAWIEILFVPKKNRIFVTSHPTWVRGLKLCPPETPFEPPWSHPTWVRGLKSLEGVVVTLSNGSHPTWVRGLKFRSANVIRIQTRRTPRGCVD